MLGPPACDTCKVWLHIDESEGGRGWYCPVCDGDGGSRYKWIMDGPDTIYNAEMVPLLRFLKGKSPQEQT